MATARIEDVASMDVVLTASCNLKCSYCYQNTKTKARMKWETLKQSIDLLANSDQSEVELTFYGGEPLLQFDLIRRGVEYCEGHAGMKPRVGYAMITNGMLLTPEVAEFLVEHDFKTRISFDGVPSVQRHRGDNTFEKLDALLDWLRREHPRFFRNNVNVGMTFMSTTTPQIAESFDYMIGKQVQEIHISLMDTNDAAWKPELKSVLDRQFERVYESSLRHFEETGEVPLSFFRKSEPDVRTAKKLSMCGVGRGETLTVDVDGEVLGCLTFARSYQTYPSDFLDKRIDEMSMGDVADERLVERMARYPAAARKAEIFHNKQDKYSSYRKCGECEYLETCEVCPISIGYIPGNTDPNRIPDHLCAWNLVTRKWRDRFPEQPDELEVLLGRAPMPAPLTRLREWVENAPTPG